MQTIKAVLFDSGRVLNKPITGHWFITPNFWRFVDKATFDCLDNKRIYDAFKKADNYIITEKLITTKEQEYTCFVKFYQIFSDCLPELNLNEEIVAKIAEDLVYNTQKYSFYEDALKIIPELHKTHKLAIVSDAWPSLVDVYDANNLTNYFETMVISSFVGALKPDPKMYLTALENLKINANEALFVDDSLKNCLGAQTVGIKSILLCRDKKRYYLNKIKSLGKGYKVIQNLTMLKKYL